MKLCSSTISCAQIGTRTKSIFRKDIPCIVRTVSWQLERRRSRGPNASEIACLAPNRFPRIRSRVHFRVCGGMGCSCSTATRGLINIPLTRHFIMELPFCQVAARVMQPDLISKHAARCDRSLHHCQFFCRHPIYEHLDRSLEMKVFRQKNECVQN